MNNLIIRGISASGGIGIGRIYILDSSASEDAKNEVTEYKTDVELGRFEFAIGKALMEIYDLKKEIKGTLSEKDEKIFDVYEAMLADGFFIQEVKDEIALNQCSAQDAFGKCIYKYIKDMENSDDEYVRQRVHDLNDLRDRVLKNITGEKKIVLDGIHDQHIAVIKELTPSIAARLGKRNVQGIVANEGAGYLSHSAIILRSLGMPALNNVIFEELVEYDRKSAIIDGYEGILIINPRKSELERYREAYHQYLVKREGSTEREGEHAVTLDGYKVGISANVSNVHECKRARNNDLKGIGMVRTELLFIRNRRMPSEKRQSLIYARLAKAMGNKPIVIRTADIGGDKIPGDDATINADPLLLNLRGIKRSLKQKDQFETQLRSILRASLVGDVNIIFPMVDKAEEVREAKSLIEKIQSDISKEIGRNLRNISIGALIETKEGVENLDNILSEVDFISLGTNDLLQQMMGVERRTSVKEKDEYLSPEFLNIVQYCVSKGKQQNKFFAVCGEMASDPVAFIILLGLGVTDFSMNPAKSSDIIDIIKRVRYSEVKELTKMVLSCDAKEDVKGVVQDWMRGKGFILQGITV